MRQKIAVAFIAKSARLLRSTTKLASCGYWPEAQIIQRSHIELQALVAFLFKDRTDYRLRKWYSNKDPKRNIWTWKDISKDLLGMHDFSYGLFSQSTHSHVFSFDEVIQGYKGQYTLHIGPAPYRKTRQLETILTMAALLNGGVVEIVADEFSPDMRITQAFHSLYSLKQYKKARSEQTIAARRASRQLFHKAMQQPKIKGIGKRYLYQTDTVL